MIEKGPVPQVPFVIAIENSKVKQMDIPVDVRRSRRKTLSISVDEDLRVVVKAPLFLSDREINVFLEKHRKWIEKQLARQRERKENARSFSPEETKALKMQARQLAEELIQKYAPQMGVKPTGLKITSAVTRWGSCSGKNSICFSYRFALLPKEAAEYIVVHELAHIRVKNHGPRFYEQVRRILPDYKERIALLKQAQCSLGL
jgi:predicted metal-dependent hydrolase